MVMKVMTLFSGANMSAVERAQKDLAIVAVKHRQHVVYKLKSFLANEWLDDNTILGLERIIKQHEVFIGDTRAKWGV